MVVEHGGMRCQCKEHQQAIQSLWLGTSGSILEMLTGALSVKVAAIPMAQLNSYSVKWGKDSEYKKIQRLCHQKRQVL